MEGVHRVGIICRDWAPAPGGVEAHTEDLARFLLGAGVEVSVLCLRPGGGEGAANQRSTQDSVLSGVSVRRVCLAKSPADPYSHSLAHGFVKQWLAESSPTLVHVHHLSGWGVGIMDVLERAGVPTVVSLHDYWSVCPRGQMLAVDGEVCSEIRPLECSACITCTWPQQGVSPAGVARRQLAVREALGKASAWIVPSLAAKSVLIRCGLSDLDLQVIPIGIDVEWIAQEVRELRQHRRPAKRLGVLGSIQPSKGVLELGRAVQAADVEGLVLDVHGPLGDYHGDGRYAAELLALAKSDERITLHGAYSREQLPRILASLDAVAVPSRWEEVYGLGLREARAAGLPVLHSGRGGLGEGPADKGRLSPYGEDVQAWARALEQLQFAPVPATPLPTLEAMGSELLDVYSRVAGSRVDALQ